MSDAGVRARRSEIATRASSTGSAAAASSASSCSCRGDDVIFSEVCPRPHDTGLVTLGSLNFSEFALHARAILGLPVPPIELRRPAASVPLLGEGSGVPRFSGSTYALRRAGLAGAAVRQADLRG